MFPVPAENLDLSSFISELFVAVDLFLGLGSGEEVPEAPTV